jgi:hypothetical protein
LQVKPLAHYLLLSACMLITYLPTTQTINENYNNNNNNRKKTVLLYETFCACWLYSCKPTKQ